MQVTKVFVNNKVSEIFHDNKETEFLFRIGSCAIMQGLSMEMALKNYIGDPTEKALVQAAKKYGLDKKDETEKQPRIKEYSFSSGRKMMSVVSRARMNT